MKLKSNLYLIIVLLITLAVSCSKHEEQSSRHTVEEAAQNLENHPEQALAMLKLVKTDVLNQFDYWYYVLLQTRAYDLTGGNIVSLLTSATKAMEYFTQQNNAEKSAFACFIVGKIYRKQNNSAKALHYNMLADEWAAKANYSIKHFNYSAIPHNIANLLNNENRYEESLNYCKKRLDHLNNNSKYTSQLYTFELIALNHHELNNMGSAITYYTKAQVIANTHNDSQSRYRTTYNKSVLLKDIKEYEAAKEECYKILPLITDTESLNKSKVHILLADIYNATNKIDSMSINLYQAKNLLNNSSDFVVKLALYKRLDLVEQKKGNQSKAAEFKQQHDQLKEDRDNNRKTEAEELKSEISQMQANHLEEVLAASEISWLQAQQQKKKARTAGYIIIAALCSTLIFFFRQKIALTFVGDEEEKTQNYQRKILFNNKLHHENFAELTVVIEDLLSEKTESKVLATVESIMEKLRANNACSAAIDIWQNSNVPKTLERSHDYKLELLNLVNTLLPKTHWSIMPELYINQYQSVVEDINRNSGWLHHYERGAVCLIAIGVFNRAETAYLLCLTDEEFDEFEQSLETKFTRKGLNLNNYLFNIRETHNIKIISHKQPLYAYLYKKITGALVSVKSQKV